MSKTLLIVVTRLYPDEGAASDEFVNDWLVTRQEKKRKGKYFKLTDEGDGLLLVHGHSKLPRKQETRELDLGKIITEAGRDAQKNQQETLTWSDYTIWVFIHGTKYQSNGDDDQYKSYTKDDIGKLDEAKIHEVMEYSSLGSGSVTHALLAVLKKEGEGRIDRLQEILLAIERVAVNPARLQVEYLNQIRELLLALQLNVAVAKKEDDPGTLNEEAVADCKSVYQEIVRCVRSPAVQKLKHKEAREDQRVFVIGDVRSPPESAKISSKLGYFELYDPPWECTEFWKSLTRSNGENVDLSNLNMNNFEHDLRALSESLHLLLRRVGAEELL